MITVHVIGLGCNCPECMIEAMEPTVAGQLIAKQAGLWWGRFIVGNKTPGEVEFKKWQLVARFALCSPAIQARAIIENWTIERIRREANRAYRASPKTYKLGTPSILCQGEGDDSAEEEDE